VALKGHQLVTQEDYRETANMSRATCEISIDFDDTPCRAPGSNPHQEIAAFFRSDYEP
jgi:hypothetical protein